MICMIILVTGCSNIECPKDSKKVNNKCFIFHYKVPEEKLTCTTGYELIDNRCVKTNRRKAEYVNTCPNGYTLQNNSCIRIESAQFSASYSCSGYYGLLIDDRCYSISNMEFKKYYYMCGAGSTLENSSCSFIRKTGMNVNIYACAVQSSYYKCTNGVTSWESNYYYGCDNAGLGGQELEHGGLCYNRNLSVPATSNNVCPTGFTKNSSGTNCTRTLSANVTTTYSCNSGEELEGSDCVTKTEKDATLSPFCADGYELIEQQCMLAEEISPIKED